MSASEPDLAAIQRRQFGAFTLAQARACGFTTDQVKRRVAAGRWVREMQGVLVDRSVAATWEQRTMTALLSRSDAAAGGLTAARLLGMCDTAPARPTLIVPRTSSGRSPIATLVRRPLDPARVVVVRGMRATDGPQTLVDLAPRLGPHHLTRLVDATLAQGIATPSAIDALIAVTPQLRAVARDALLSSIEVWRGQIRPGSVPEARLLRQLDEWGFGRPERQVPIVGPDGQVIARVDAGWSHRRLGLEYDSTQWHGPARWEDDEARHRRIEALGWTLLHVDGQDLRPGSDLRLRVRRAWLASEQDLPADLGA